MTTMKKEEININDMINTILVVGLIIVMSIAIYQNLFVPRPIVQLTKEQAEQFCSQNFIYGTNKGMDDYYITINGQKYEVKTHE